MDYDILQKKITKITNFASFGQIVSDIVQGYGFFCGDKKNFSSLVWMVKKLLTIASTYLGFKTTTAYVQIHG